MIRFWEGFKAGFMGMVEEFNLEGTGEFLGTVLAVIIGIILVILVIVGIWFALQLVPIS